MLFLTKLILAEIMRPIVIFQYMKMFRRTDMTYSYYYCFDYWLAIMHADN